MTLLMFAASGVGASASSHGVRSHSSFLDGGVDVNKRSEQRGWSGLHIAARNGCFDAAALLLEHGADVHTLTIDGQTPLFVATARGHAQVVALLRTNGAKNDATSGWMTLRPEDAGG
jgi:ankyrin repeat protein